MKIKDRFHYFLAKIAGSNSDEELIPRTQTEYWLNEIAESVEKNSLPEVSAADNGKVLGVVDGEWGPIESSGGGSSEVPENDVTFYDYDGTVVYSYSAEEFAALTELPPNPEHEGLIAEGWNWTLEDAKVYVAAHGGQNIAQHYITDDDKTRIYISVNKDYKSLYLSMNKSNSGSGIDLKAYVDWGDGSEISEVLGSKPGIGLTHTYENPGDYVIKVSHGGTLGLFGSNTKHSGGLIRKDTSTSDDNVHVPYRLMVKKIELGARVEIGSDAFGYFNNLEEITIPKNIVFSSTDSIFYRCGKIKFASFPSGITALGGSVVGESTRAISIPKTVNSIKGFNGAKRITRIFIPENVSISSGSYFLYGNSRLKKIVFPSTTSISSSIASSFTNSWQYTEDLEELSIPEGLITIVSNSFASNYSLRKLIIPSTVSSIKDQLTNVSLYSLVEIHFKNSNPPTLLSNSIFTASKLNPNLKIYVPTGSLSAYESAANYPSSASFTYIEE